MLGFFRKYQNYFFIVTTVIMVISFTFFGTYSTLTSGPTNERTAFVAVDGEHIGQWELEQMVRFMSTDQAVQRAYGTSWGPNFLNDGVLTQDILKKGIASLLVQQLPESVKTELQAKLKRERNVSHYVHPAARFISAESAWGYFSPQLKQSLDQLIAAEDATSAEALEARVNLYLAQEEFPPSALKQLLRYQEQQYSWLPADPNLASADLSLFGYHSLEDWFGKRFVQLAAMYIINSAKIAEEKGYVVTDEEALAGLVYNADLAYKARSGAAGTGMTGPVPYMREQLRRMGLEQNQAVWIWRNVLLFRRLFNAVGSAVFIDPFVFHQFNEFALESVSGDLYELPQPLQLASFRDLQLFETYLDLVTDRSETKNPLDLPKQFWSAAKVKEAHPELVQKRYVLEVVEVPLKSLQARVRVKDLWDWQVDEKNWKLLSSEFPELGVAQASSRQDRFNAMEKLSEITRKRVDEFSRNEIVKLHPDWLDQALENKKAERVTAAIRARGGSLPVNGVEDRNAFMALLDSAPLAEKDDVISEELAKYSADGNTYYRIKVLARDPDWQVLSFGEARGGDALNEALQARLEQVYPSVRDSEPEKYRDEKGNWKPIQEVQDQVAAVAFRKVIQAIQADSKQLEGKNQPLQEVATRRFLHPTRQALQALQQTESESEKWVAKKTASAQDGFLPTYNLEDQWKLTHSEETLRRSDDGARVGGEPLFSLSPGSWTEVVLNPNGRAWFFHVASHDTAPSGVMIGQQMKQAQEALATEAQLLLARSVLSQLNKKDAMQFLLTPQSDVEPPKEGGQRESDDEL